MKLLVSNNSELLRHLGSSPFRGLPMEVEVVTGGEAAAAVALRDRPALCIFDAEMSDLSGYEASRRIKAAWPQCRVVLVLGNRIGKDQLRLVSECSCDEVLIAPMGADQLYDVIAIQLDLPRRGARRFDIALKIATEQGEQPINGRVTNFSVDGARLLLDGEVAEGSLLRLEILPSGEPVMSIAARVVWAQKREGGCTVGAAFEDVTPDLRQQLARLTLWEILRDPDRTRIVIKGDITEATRFDDLLPALVGRIDFDLGQVRYMNSLGVREWVDMLQRAPIHGYEFHACSVAFVLQASLVEGVLGRGAVRSFFAPYACDGCGHTEERLLQAAAVLATEGQHPPTFACRTCGGHLVLDDIPERYLAFLRPRRDG